MTIKIEQKIVDYAVVKEQEKQENEAREADA